MASNEELEQRVAALELKFAVSEGGHDAVIGLLKDQSRTLAAHQAWLDQVDARLAGHDARFDQIDARLAGHDARFDQIDARLTAHDARFDQVDRTLVEHGTKLDVIVDWIQRQP
ncbi:hypothetical protein GCM10009547_18120 [Sporichthya brevicatena]|uniref:Uncharacterized protein n=1 Tax=Sporichthya brevicatena TaxID=171442 RepID=A0ABN1GQH1_9ACTN